MPGNLSVRKVHVAGPSCTDEQAASHHHKQLQVLQGVKYIVSKVHTPALVQLAATRGFTEVKIGKVWLPIGQYQPAAHGGKPNRAQQKKKKESRANGLRRRPAASTTGGTQRPPSNNPEQGVPRGRGLKRRPADSSTASIQRPRAIGPVHGESRPSQWDRPEGDRPGGIGFPRIDRLIEQIPESEPPFNFKVQATTALVANIPKDRELRSLARQKLKDIGFQNVSCLRGIVGRTVVTACKQASGLVQELTLSRSHNVDAVKGMRKVRMRSKTAERAPGAFGCAMTHNRILQLIQSNSTYFVDNSTTRRQYVLVAEDDIVTCRG